MTRYELITIVKAMQKQIAEAYRAKDLKKVKSLQMGRMRSKAGAGLAIMNVLKSSGAATPGVDKEI